MRAANRVRVASVVVVLSLFGCGASGPDPTTERPGVSETNPIKTITEHGGGPLKAVAALRGTPASGPTPLTEVLDAMGSHGGDGNLTCAWDFGDGSGGTNGCLVSHVYAVSGQFDAVVFVTDGTGATASASVHVEAQSTGGETRAASLFALYLNGGTVSGDPAGDAYVALNDGGGATLLSLQADGQFKWSYRHDNGFFVSSAVSDRRFWVSGRQTYVSPEGGNLLIVGFGRTAADLTAPGFFTADLTTFFQGDGNAAGPFAIQASEAVAARVQEDNFVWQLWIQSGGEWSTPWPANGALRFDQVAVAPDGSVYGAAEVLSPVTLQDHFFQPGLVLMKFDSQRRLLWTSESQAGGHWTGIATSQKGTVVGAASVDRPAPGALGSTSGGWLVTLESNGRARNVRASAALEPRVAVDPVGELVVAGRTAEQATLQVEKYNLAGNLLWARQFIGELRVDGVSIADHDVLLLVALHGSADFGTGTLNGLIGSEVLVRLGR